MSREADVDFSCHVPEYVSGRAPVRRPLPEGFKSGLDWTSIVIQSHLMMPLLRRLCAARGVGLKKKEISNVDQFVASEVRVFLFFSFFFSNCFS